jgi:hypothetical protein
MKAELMEPMRRRPSAGLLVIDQNNRALLFRFVFKRGPLAGQNYWRHQAAPWREERALWTLPAASCSRKRAF